MLLFTLKLLLCSKVIIQMTSNKYWVIDRNIEYIKKRNYKMNTNDKMKQNICRICLNQDIKLFSISNSSLKVLFEKLTDIEVSIYYCFKH